jgi:hypothetical protein
MHREDVAHRSIACLGRRHVATPLLLLASELVGFLYEAADLVGRRESGK